MNKKILLILVAMVAIIGYAGSELAGDLLAHDYTKPAEEVTGTYNLTAECLIDGNTEQIGVSFFSVNATDTDTTSREIKNHMAQACNECDTGSECLFISTNAPRKTAGLTANMRWDYANRNFFDGKGEVVLKMPTNELGAE